MEKVYPDGQFTLLVKKSVGLLHEGIQKMESKMAL